MKSEKYGIEIPEILLPTKVDVAKWSVIACDQYTQDAAYWKKAAEIVGSEPSTLNLIFPEVYLEDSGKDERIQKIHAAMEQYIADGVFAASEKEAMYVERTVKNGKKRAGLVVAVDLDAYDWTSKSRALIRATEATIPERIPPRKAIRDGAALESPHIMLLVNDKARALVEETGRIAKMDGETAYDGDFMLSGGHISGWKVKSERAKKQLFTALESVKTANTAADGSVFMFAVGDGNHSLATAKAVWEDFKAKNPGVTDHPLRYALAEIVNIYDDALDFKPIHRVLFGADTQKLLSFLQKELGGTLSVGLCESEMQNAVNTTANGANFGFSYRADGALSHAVLSSSIAELAVSRLQPALDAFLRENPAVKIDYIHGEDELLRLAHEGALSIFLPPIQKDGFFATIVSTGTLPRKSFSMGEADEKRFYLECRALR